MSIIHDSRFRITTIWPELVNKRITAVDIQLRESQYTNRENQLLVNGIIQRRISYLEYDGRSRKTEDRLQFEIIVNNIESYIGPDPFEIELQQDYFIFQPRRIGENQAVFEHGFGVIISRRKNDGAIDVTSDTLVPMLAQIIREQGEGAVTLSQPVSFAKLGVEPLGFQGEICFNSNLKELPLISGMLKSRITFINQDKTLAEMKMETPFHFILKIPPLNDAGKFQIQGSIIDWVWLFDINLQMWRLECKLDYQWRIIEAKEVICITSPQTVTPNCLLIEAPLRLTELNARLTKSISLPMGNMRTVAELKLIRQKCCITAHRKGILAEFELDLEIYAVDEQGREAYLRHPVTWEEVITANFNRVSPEKILPVLKKNRIQLIHFLFEDAILQIDMRIDLQISFYQNQLLKISESNDSATLILGKVVKDQKDFSLLRNAILQLRSKPVLIQRLTVRNITVESQSRQGWLHVSGQMELGVAYLDEKRCLREDTFPVFLRENFLWDKLKTSDEVKIKSRLEHDSYALHTRDPLKLNYRFLLSLIAEGTDERVIKVNISSNPADMGPGDLHLSNRFLELSAKKPLLDRLPADCWIADDNRCSMRRFDVEADIPLILGRAQDIENGRFIIGNFSYRNESGLVLVEGNLDGELDYWDSEGYFRTEPVSCEFWKCFRHDCGLARKDAQIIPKLHQLRFIAVKTAFWRKGRVKIIFQVELQQIIEGEGI